MPKGKRKTIKNLTQDNIDKACRRVVREGRFHVELLPDPDTEPPAWLVRLIDRMLNERTETKREFDL